MQAYHIHTQDHGLTEEQLKQIQKIDINPLKFLDQLIEASKIKENPQPLNIKKSQIFDSHAVTQELIDDGIQILKDKKAALLIMAGGAATRLGASVPKGAY